MKLISTLPANSGSMAPDAATGIPPRSVLHALEPIGLGTPEVESLTSYFCRLANSHSCTTNDLAKFVIERIEPDRWNTYQMIFEKGRFVWYERSISGLGESALSWVSVLTALTGVSTLQQLTLLPLRDCVAAKGLMATQARWCPQCFAEDQACGHQPYFRLAWDIGINKTCVRHGVRLTARCPHCEASNVRHSATYVVPGWCTACGHFLGDATQTEAAACEPAKATPTLEARQADCVGHLLESTSTPMEVGSLPVAQIDALHLAIEHLIENLDGGVAAHFARRLGLRKSTIHHWRTRHAPLTLDALVRIALHCGIALPSLVRGELEGWVPPSAGHQLALHLQLPPSARHRPKREHNWEAIRRLLHAELERPEPRSVTEIAQELDIDPRLLYIRATEEARRLGERYIFHRRMASHQRQLEIHHHLGLACDHLCASGEGITPEGIAQQLGPEILKKTRNMYTTLSICAERAANDAA